MCGRCAADPAPAPGAPVGLTPICPPQAPLTKKIIVMEPAFPQDGGSGNAKHYGQMNICMVSLVIIDYRRCAPCNRQSAAAVINKELTIGSTKLTLLNRSISVICKMYLNGSWTSRSAGFFEGRQIWEVCFGDILILHMFGISTHVYVYIYMYIYKHIYIYVMLEFNMLAFVLCCNWLGPRLFFVKCTLLGTGPLGQLDFLKAVRFGSCVLGTF